MSRISCKGLSSARFWNARLGIGCSVLLGVALWMCPLSAQAQDDLLGELYGAGVHRYFQGDYAAAHKHLTQAIDGGSNDPRAYYFRGLCYAQLGRPEQAEDDFETGARLEAAGETFYPIGRSLERIQGSARLQIETERRLAKIAIRDQERAVERARYERLEAAEPEVLRPPMGAGGPGGGEAAPPPIEPTDDGAGDGGAGGLVAPTDPFGEGAVDRLGRGPSEDAPAGPARGGGTSDPFGDSGTITPPGGGDVFGGDAGTPPGGDPFGEGPATPPGGGEDDFGGGAPGTPPGGDPFGGGEAPAGPGGDPFGGGAGPAPGGDPFGGGGEAPAPGGDPFGGGAAPGGDDFGGGAPAGPAPGGDSGGGPAGAIVGEKGGKTVGSIFRAVTRGLTGSAGDSDDGDGDGDDAGGAPFGGAPGGGDPFGAPGGAAPGGGGDPFADDPEQPAGGAAPAPGGAPFGEAAPAPGGDPFGDDPFN